MSSTLSEVEIRTRKLQGLLPRRVSRKVRCLGPTTKELGCKKLDPGQPPNPEEQQSKWDSSNPPDSLDEREKRRLLAVAVGLAVKVVFSHHIYKFGGHWYRQLVGGPIGLHLSCCTYCDGYVGKCLPDQVE